MAWMLKCECGELVRAETGDAIVAAVERHIGAQHPDLVGRFSSEQILAMAEMV